MKLLAIFILFSSSIFAVKLNYDKSIDITELPDAKNIITLRWHSSMYPEENYDDFSKKTRDLAYFRTLKRFNIIFRGRFLPNGIAKENDLLIRERLKEEFFEGKFENQAEEFEITEVLASEVAKRFDIFDLNLFDYPYFFYNYDHLNEFFKTPIAKELCDRVKNEKVVCLGFIYTNGFRYILTDKLKLSSVSDFEKLVMPEPEGELNVAFYRTLGVKLINDDTAKEYLEDKFVEEGEGSSGDLYNYFDGEDEDVKYLNATLHSVKTSMILISRKKYDSLSKDDKQRMHLLFKEISNEQRKFIINEEKEVMKDLAKFKTNIVKFNIIQKQLMDRKLKRFKQKYEPKFDPILLKKVKGFADTL
ncbi:MAG: hypothetical protein GY909_08200 [Oligoflexia bacterium]|nr:hypothetical protein [Oligoflexia bacterium]